MEQHRIGRFVRLAQVGDVATARVLAALLESEGIEVRLHSEALGPYPVTVGSMAATDLWVLEDRVEEASALLLDAEVNDALGAVDHEDRPPLLEIRVVAGVLIALVLLAVILRLMRVF